METVQLDLANESQCSAWDTFVLEHPDGSVFHSSLWARTIAAAYGATSLCMVFKDGETTVGVFPLFCVKDIRQRDTLVSVPYAPCGGILSLPAYAESILADAGVSRSVPRKDSPTLRAYAAACCTMVVSLPAEKDALWSRLPDKERNQIRKPQKEGLKVDIGRDLLDRFYPLYARRMHELGTPPHAAKFFSSLQNSFGDCAEFVVAYYRTKPVAALFDVSWGNTRYNLYGASDIRCRPLCANDLAYWESMKRAVDQKEQRYDFGRCRRDSGQYRFKQKWGAQPAALRKYVWAFDKKSGTWNEQSLVPSSGPSKVWRRIPFPLATALGQCIRRFVF
jgi:FemAB-related protein (PEP-CTERM system-associated)